MRLRALGVMTALLVVLPVLHGHAQPADVRSRSDVIAESVQGRDIVAHRMGASNASRVIVVIGQMHGNEPGGRDVVRRLRSLTPPPDVAIWTILSMNPDGHLRRSRFNARGVDLNRNFPDRWSTSVGYNPGKRPASEPETRGMMTFLETLKPDLVISYHQDFDVVDVGNRLSLPWARAYAADVGMGVERVSCNGPCRGTMTGWLNRELDMPAFTVELDGSVSPVEANRHARAVISLAKRP